MHEPPAASLVQVEVPYVLRQYCGGAATVTVDSSTVRGVLVQLEARFPDLYRCVCEETGAVRRHVNLFVNTAHIRDRNGLDSDLKPGDILIILPAVSGG